jgi:hypothetical protein
MKYVLVLKRYHDPGWIGYLYERADGTPLVFANLEAAKDWRASAYDIEPLTREACRHISAQKKRSIAHPFYLGFEGIN